MNAYEITYIVRPDLDDEQTRAVVDQITERLESAEAEIVATIPWNPPRRRMAYPIRDFGDGFYVTSVFRVESSALPPLENFLKLNERVLRYLLVQATDLNIKQAQQRLQQQQAAAAAPRPQTAAAPEQVPEQTTEPAPEQAPEPTEGAATAEQPVEAEAVPTPEVVGSAAPPEAEPVGVASESPQQETEE